MSYPTGDPNQQNPGFQPRRVRERITQRRTESTESAVSATPQRSVRTGRWPGWLLRRTAPKTSFLGSLFDLKFTQFVTLRVIPVLYTISLVLISIVAVIYFFVALIAGFAAFGDDDTGPAFGVFLLLVAFVVVPLIWLLYVVLTRVIYEFFLSIVRIADNTDPRHRR